MKFPAKAAAIILLALTVPLAPSAPRAADFETPPVLAAKDYLPDDLLKGEHHEVEARVGNDGYMNHYTIRSDFGTFEARSTAMARVRISEVGGIAKLKELSRTEAFAGALAASAKKTAKSAGQIVSDPVGTAKAIPGGVGRMVKRMSLSVDKTLDKGDGTAAKQGGEGEGGDGGKGSDQAVEAGKNLIGVNPYSDNEVLRAELDRLAWAAFGGGFALDRATSGIPLTGEIGQVGSLVWETGPADLEVMGREKLAKMGVPKEQVDAFYRAPHLTPTSTTAVVVLLESMSGVSGLAEVVRLASSLEDVEGAGFFVASAAMLKGCHEKKGPLARILAGPVLPWGARGDGTLVLAFALDHLVWTEDIAAAAAKIDGAAQSDASIAGVELWVSGTLSPRTREELTALGWAVHEKAAGELGLEGPR